MTVCKFFLEGRCRYGSNCRFEHPRQGDRGNQYNDGNYYGNQPDRYHYMPQNQQSYQTNSRQPVFQTGNKFGVLAESRFQNSQPERQETRPGQSTSVHEIAKQEVDLWIKGNQWLFSCFAPLKDGHNVPGMEDTSPEELRYEAYEAKAKGTTQEYLTRFQLMTQEAQQKRLALLNPNAQLSEVLVRLARGEKLKAEPATAPFASLGGSSAASSFSFAKAAQNLQQPSGPFAGQTNASASSTFSFAKAAQSILHTPAAPTGFAANVGSAFGFPGAPQAPVSSFGNVQQPLPQPSTFGSAPPIQVQPTSVFGNVNSVPQTAPAASNITANTTRNTATTSVTTNTYTPIENLTPEDKAQFSAPKFTLGKIPIVPPPREVC